MWAQVQVGFTVVLGDVDALIVVQVDAGAGSALLEEVNMRGKEVDRQPLLFPLGDFDAPGPPDKGM